MNGLIFFLAVLAFTVPNVTAPAVVQAMPAKTFIESLGVNVHMNYTDGRYANVSDVENDLAYTGIRYVRDNMPTTNSIPGRQGLAAFHALAERGIRFDIGASTDLANDLDQLGDLERFHRGMVASVEGPNEINNFPVKYNGLTGQAAADSFQRDLYQAVHANAYLAGVPVYHFTGGRKVSGASLAGMADYANEHPYPRGGNPPRAWLTSAFESYYSDLGNIPKVITETGYYTLPSSRNWGGVDELTQAKLLLTTYFAAAELGVKRTYVYQLLDAYPDLKQNNIDCHFGFFDLNNTAKSAAAAMHNLTKYLGDSKAIDGQLGYSFSGLPASGHSILLSKSDGSFVIAVWNEVPVWNEKDQKPVQSGPVAATLCVGRRATLSSYDPLNNSSVKLAKSGACSQVMVEDHPTLIAIR